MLKIMTPKEVGLARVVKLSESETSWRQVYFTHTWQHLKKPIKHSAGKKINPSVNIRASSLVYWESM